MKGLTTFSRSWSSEGKSSSTLFSHRNKLRWIALPNKKKNLNTQADLQDDGRSSLQQHQSLPSLVEENRNVSSIFFYFANSFRLSITLGYTSQTVYWLRSNFFIFWGMSSTRGSPQSGLCMKRRSSDDCSTVTFGKISVKPQTCLCSLFSEKRKQNGNNNRLPFDIRLCS